MLTKRVVVVVRRWAEIKVSSRRSFLERWPTDDDEVGDEEERESNSHSPGLTSEQSRFAEVTWLHHVGRLDRTIVKTRKQDRFYSTINSDNK
jgi:hypothetical protein